MTGAGDTRPCFVLGGALTKTILVVSDLHVNSTVAICPPAVQLDDGGSYKRSRGQAWLWDNWLKLCERVKQYPGFVAVLNGDICEGDAKNRSYQTISRNEASIIGMTAAVLNPLLVGAGCTYVVRGTEAHVGKSAALEELIARDIDAAKCPETGAASWWGLLLSVEGVRLDIAHHASMGGLPWTSPSAAQRYAARVMFTYSDAGERPPELAIRSHVHRWGDSYDAHRTRAIFTPAWTLATSYTHRIAPGALAEIGAVLVHVDGGRYEVEKFKVEAMKRIWTTLPKTNC